MKNCLTGLWLIDSIFSLIAPRYVVDEEAGGGAENKEPTPEEQALDILTGKTALPDDGKANDAPVDRQGDDDKKTEGDQKPGTESPDKTGQAPEIKDDELEKALGFSESPEEKVQRLERDYGASSAEAKRLNGEKKAIADALKDQGLKLSIKDGKVDFIPTDKYNDGAVSAFSVKVDKLSQEEQDILAAGDLGEIQKVINRIVDEVKSKAVRAAPTRDKEPAELSDERRDSVFKQMKEATDTLGEPKYQGFEKNIPLILRQISDPALPESVKEAFKQNPEFMAELLNARVQVIRLKLAEQAMKAAAEKTKKEEEARKAAEAKVESNGTVSQGGEKAKQFLDEMFSPQ